MYKLDKLLIQNYKSIQYAEIRFSNNKTVFVGKNSTGKSNILKALRLFFTGEHKTISINSFNNPEKIIKLELSILKNKVEYIKLLITAKINNGKVEVKYEENYSDEEKNKINDFLENVDFLYIPDNRNFFQKNHSWYKDIINLIINNRSNEIESEEILENLKKIVLSIKEIIKDKNIQFNNGKQSTPLNLTNYSNEILVNLDYDLMDEDFGELKNFNNMSLSTKNSLFVALFDLYQKSLISSKNDRFRVFVIDQVENFLHPHSIRLIDKVLQDISERDNTQIIYTTHSSELVSNFKKGKYEINSVRFVYKQHKLTKVKQIQNKYGNYERIMLNLMFKSSDVFFSDAVILIEGETEKIAIPNIYEYWHWNEDSLRDCRLDKCDRVIGKNKIDDFFNIFLKNIAVVDVGGKGSLADWYLFCSELLGKRNVFAIIDKDANYYEDKKKIEESIRKVHGKTVKENEYGKYNWIVLDGEFESYYKPDKINEFLYNLMKDRFKDDRELQHNINSVIDKINHLKQDKKISINYERLFKTYLKGYSKPAIAFNLSIRLCQNNGYKPELIKILKNIIYKVEENKLIDGN